MEIAAFLYLNHISGCIFHAHCSLPARAPYLQILRLQRLLISHGNERAPVWFVIVAAIGLAGIILSKLTFRKGIMTSQQRSISRLIAQAGQMLLAHGAESTLVGDIMRRIGLACGMSEVEVSLSASSLVVTTVQQGHCITTTRRCADRGINMRAVTEIQRICIMIERGLLDHTMAQKKLNQISPERYNRWVVVVMIGLSCAAFSRLAGGDWTVFAITFIASAVGMTVRQEIGHRHFNPLLNFAATAFVTSVISAQAVNFQLGNNPTLVMASSVLMLVPGFPLINSVADMLKGYIDIGIARFVMASLLTLSTCLGIIAAMSVTGIWGW